MFETRIENYKIRLTYTFVKYTFLDLDKRRNQKLRIPNNCYINI